MPQLKLKKQVGTVHIPGLGVFEPDKFTDVSDDDIKTYESRTRKVITRKDVKNDDNEVVDVEVTEEEKKLKVSDLFEVKKDPVEKKDTAAKKADDGGDE